MITEKDLVKQVEEDKGKKYILLAIFITAIIGFIILLTFMPHFTEQEKTTLYRWPKSPQDLFNIVQVICRQTRCLRTTPKITQPMFCLLSSICTFFCSHLLFQDQCFFVYSLGLSLGTCQPSSSTSL